MTYQTERPGIRKITRAIQTLRGGQEPVKAATAQLGAQLPLYPADLIGAVSGVPIQAVIKVIAALAILESAGEDIPRIITVDSVPDDSPREDASRPEAVRIYLDNILGPWAKSNRNNTAVAYDMGLLKKLQP